MNKSRVLSRKLLYFAGRAPKGAAGGLYRPFSPSDTTTGLN